MRIRPFFCYGLIFSILLALLLGLGENMVRGNQMKQYLQSTDHNIPSRGVGIMKSADTATFLADLNQLDMAIYGQLVSYDAQAIVSDQGQYYQCHLIYRSEAEQSIALLIWLETQRTVKKIIDFKLIGRDNLLNTGNTTLTFDVDILLSQ